MGGGRLRRIRQRCQHLQGHMSAQPTSPHQAHGGRPRSILASQMGKRGAQSTSGFPGSWSRRKLGLRCTRDTGSEAPSQGVCRMSRWQPGEAMQEEGACRVLEVAARDWRRLLGTGIKQSQSKLGSHAWAPWHYRAWGGHRGRSPWQ